MLQLSRIKFAHQPHTRMTSPLTLPSPHQLMVSNPADSCRHGKLSAPMQPDWPRPDYYYSLAIYLFITSCHQYSRCVLPTCSTLLIDIYWTHYDYVPHNTQHFVYFVSMKCGIISFSTLVLASASVWRMQRRINETLMMMDIPIRGIWLLYIKTYIHYIQVMHYPWVYVYIYVYFVEDLMWRDTYHILKQVNRNLCPSSNPEV